jgi:hypothetical protein
MTESYTPGPPRTETPSTPQAVREQAANVGQGAAQAGGRVAQTAAEQGRQVARETGRQARNLVNEASSEMNHQASMQQKRAAEGLRSIGSELHAMANHSEQGGLASELVSQAADRAHQAAHWLDHRQPGEVVEEVRAYARRHPGAFLAGAVLAGVVVGRLTRNLASGPESGATDTYHETAQVPPQRVVTEPLPPTSTVYPAGTATTYQSGAAAHPTGGSYQSGGQYGTGPYEVQP